VRYADLLRISLSALWQQKVRTCLTMAGVVIGTFLLVVCLSLGRGYEREVISQFNSGAVNRQILVMPGSGVKEADIPPEELQVTGPMSEAKRLRIRRAIIHRWPFPSPGVQLNRERVYELGRLPHVESVIPFVKKRCKVTLAGKKSYEVRCFAANAGNPHFRNRIVAGRYFTSDNEWSVVVSEYLLYRWGIIDDSAVANVVGKKLRIEYYPAGPTRREILTLLREADLDLTPGQKKHLERAVRALPVPTKEYDSPLFREEFTIAGVLREFIEDEDSYDVFDLGPGYRSKSTDVFLPAQTAAELFGRGTEQDLLDYPGVIITVDQERNIKPVAYQVRSQGLEEDTLVDVVRGVRTILVLIQFVTAFLAGVALLVAALGITNTMIMTVLERTREIGVMKAVGARDGHIQMMFLLEGALIGVLGGGLGVLCGWIVSFPGDSIVRSILEDKSLPPINGTLFDFPLWLTLGVPLFAGLVTTLAAVYPAWRATRVNPILALRHE
jgi:putative ABC transport system permease protein